MLLAACSLTTSLDSRSSGALTPLATPEAGGVAAGGSPEASAALDGSTGQDAAGGAEAGPPGPFCAAIVPKPCSSPSPRSVRAGFSSTRTCSSPRPARLVLGVDGKTAFDGVADPFYRPGVVAVGAGIHYTDTPSGPLALHVDDLYLDSK